MGKDIVEHVLLEFAMLVAFGTAGGTPPPIDPQILMERSLTVVVGDLWNHLVSRNARIDRAAAHARLEDRAFSGKIVMTSEE